MKVSKSIPEDLYRQVLNKCGYDDCAATKESVIECFLDYVDSGAFRNLDTDQAKEDIESGEITILDICYGLLRLK